MSWRSSREAARALGCWLLIASAALAQRSAVEVRSPSAKLLDTAPGRIVTASVVVANRGGEGDEFSERLTLPPGAVKVAPADLPFRLAAGAQTVRILAVQLPASMPAGRFDLRYSVQSRRDPASLGSFDFSVEVLPVDGLALVVEPRTDPVLAGDNYAIRARVTNHGNRRLPVRLLWRSSLHYRVTGGDSLFDLEAGATREIFLRVDTDKHLARRSSHAVTFEARAMSASGRELSESQASVVDIIPLTSGERDPFHQLPMQLTLTGLAERGHDVQFQAELSGAGSLDEAGRERIDFVFRGPDVQNTSLFGERDEYGARYHDETWDVDLGDRIYALSPLTERHSLGRGGGVTWHEDGTTVGGFYMSTRFRQRNTGELGAFVRRDVTEVFSLQGNFLRKTGGDFAQSHALPQDIATIAPRLHFGKVLDLNAEAGASRSDDGATDHAYRAEAHGELPGRLTYAVEHIHAGPHFHGYESDTETTYGTVAKAFTPKFRVHGSINRYAGNLALNEVRSSVVNRENSWNAGADFAATKRTNLSVEWQHTHREDILKPAAYDFTEDSARLGLGQRLGRVQLQSFLDLGTLDNQITGQSGPFQRYSGYLTWQPTPRQSYSAFASYGPSAFTGSSDQSLNAGLSAHWQFNERLAANLSYARNQFDGLTGREQDQAMGSLRYQFADRSTFSLIGRWSQAVTRGPAGTPDTNEAAVLASYSVPLSLPVTRKRSIGGLQGRLYDASREVGVARVVLQVGEQFAVTDSEGGFEFPGLKPGACELRVLADSLGPRLCMVTPLPLKLKIRPGETTRVELAAAPACALAVRVTLHEFADGTSLNTSGALREAVALELSNGRETWRAETDRTGAASFDRLPGGRWTLRAVGAEIPALHFIENPERTLALKPGTGQTVDFRVLPKRRTLRILDQGAIR